MTLPLDVAKLQLVLADDTDIIIRRNFSHPPARVWRAMTDPVLIPKWLEGMTRCKIDLRPGGSFRYDWDAFSFTGQIVEVDAPHRMVHVEHFSGDPNYRVEITVTLEARGTGTCLTSLMRYADATARASAIEKGFTDGLDEVYGLLEALEIPD